MKDVVTSWLILQEATFFHYGIETLISHYDRCLNRLVNYIGDHKLMEKYNMLMINYKSQSKEIDVNGMCSKIRATLVAKPIDVTTPAHKYYGERKYDIFYASHYYSYVTVIR